MTMWVYNSNFRILALGLVALSTGCASIEADYFDRARERSLVAAQALKDLPPCCEDFAQMDFQSLSPERTMLSFGGAETSQVRVFDSGPSYFVPIDLGPSPVGLELTVRSILWRESRDQTEVLVVPSVLAFDEQYQIVGRIPRLELCFQQYWSEVGYYGFLNVTDSRARYLVFYTDPKVVASTSRFFNSVTTVYGDITADRQLPNSAIGEMEIWRRSEKDKSHYNGCSANNVLD